MRKYYLCPLNALHALSLGKAVSSLSRAQLVNYLALIFSDICHSLYEVIKHVLPAALLRDRRA